MKQSWQLRSQKQLYQVIRDTQMSFLLLSSGTQITLSTEACEKKLAHRDLLMGLRWNWIRCKPAFLDTIRYLEITEGLRRQQAQSFLRAQGPANGDGSGTAVSWVNTPMSRLLVGTGGREGSGGRLWVCAAGKSIRSSGMRHIQLKLSRMDLNLTESLCCFADQEHAAFRACDRTGVYSKVELFPHTLCCALCTR